MNTEFEIKSRNEQLKLVAPEMFSEGYKDILYVGAKLNEPIRKQFKWQMESLSRHGCVTILEIWEENCHGLVDHEWFGRLYHDVRCGDVRERGIWFEEGLYDFSLWWHGPEHVMLKELSEALNILEDITEKAVILGCPWGVYEQGEMYGNKWEKHQQPMYPEMFHELGYRTWTSGEVDTKGSNLIARKDISV